MLELTLVGAYGRDYKTLAELKAAWEGGKDFKIATVVSKDCGRYASVRDLKLFPGEHVKLRYNGNASFALVRIADGEITDGLSAEEVADCPPE